MVSPRLRTPQTALTAEALLQQTPVSVAWSIHTPKITLFLFSLPSFFFFFCSSTYKCENEAKLQWKNSDQSAPKEENKTTKYRRKLPSREKQPVVDTQIHFHNPHCSFLSLRLLHTKALLSFSLSLSLPFLRALKWTETGACLLGRGAVNLFPSLCYRRQRNRRIQNVATPSPSMLKNSDLTTAWVTQHPPVHHPKIPVLGFHGWDETVSQGSVYLVSSFFFPKSHFFPGPSFPAPFLLSLFFLVQPSLNPILFLRAPTHSSNLPTFLPPPNPSTSPYLPHHPFALPYAKLQNHRDLDGELVELVELVVLDVFVCCKLWNHHDKHHAHPCGFFLFVQPVRPRQWAYFFLGL